MGRLGALLYGEGTPVFLRTRDLDTLATARDAGLNAPQRAAVEKALNADGLALIHGPPGTGKTRTLVEVIARAVARGERILATAMSNTAVDHLAAGLIGAGLPVLRLGHPTRIAPLVEARRLATAWMSEARRLRNRAFTPRSSRRWCRRGSTAGGWVWGQMGGRGLALAAS